MLERPLQCSGELFYQAPDHLEKRTLQPRPETLVLDHGVLTARRGQRTHVLSLRDYPQIVPFVESIRATLAGDGAALERYFHVSFAGTLERWTLELVPAEATVARSVQLIRIAGERDSFGHPEQQIAMRGALPNAELCILPAAGHDVMNDQPELFRLAALDFLRRNESL